MLLACAAAAKLQAADEEDEFLDFGEHIASDFHSLDARLRSLTRVTGSMEAEPAKSRWWSETLTCLRPIEREERGRRFNDSLLEARLQPGRHCSSDLCSSDRCALHVLDRVVTSNEAAELRAHASAVCASTADEGGSTTLADLHSLFSAPATQRREGHKLFLRLVERLRRVTAHLFSLPVSRLRVADMHIALTRPQDLAHNVHCDEASYSNFHFSSVLFLGNRFAGGPLQFYRNKTWGLTHSVDAFTGRGVFFSSGCAHAIKNDRRSPLPTGRSILFF